MLLARAVISTNNRTSHFHLTGEKPFIMLDKEYLQYPNTRNIFLLQRGCLG